MKKLLSIGVVTMMVLNVFSFSVRASQVDTSTLKPDAGKLIGDISRGNHKLSNLDNTTIIVPRPSKSMYEGGFNNGTVELYLSNIIDISGNVYEQIIKDFAKSGYITQLINDKGEFKPNEPIKYLEMFTILANLQIRPVRFGGAYEPYINSKSYIVNADGTEEEILYSDLPYFTNDLKMKKTDWYYSYMLKASEAGFFGSDANYSEIMNRNDNKKKVASTDKVTRQYACLYLSHMLDICDTSNYVLSCTDLLDIDSNDDNITLNAVKTMLINNIVTLYDDNTFKPNQEITRAEMVGLIQQILNLYNNDKEVIHDNLYGNYFNFSWQQEKELLKRVNERRINAGVNPLQYNPTNTAIARIRAIDYSINGYNWDKSHTSEIYKKADVEDVNRYFEYSTGWVAENLTSAYVMAENADNMWNGSKGHREAMLYPKYTDFGCSVGIYYDVELFTMN